MTRFDPPLPRRRWPIWLAMTLALLSLPAVAFVYYPAMQRAGAYPGDADSTSIPIFTLGLASLLAAPVLALITYLCLKNYRGGTLLAWRWDRPMRSAILTVLFGAPALYAAVGIVKILRLAPPWVELVWAVPHVALIAWLLLARAAALSPRSAA